MVGLDFGVVGPGRVGLSLARRLVAGGATCRWVIGRRPPAAGDERRLAGGASYRWWGGIGEREELPDLVLVCVADGAVSEAAAQLAASHQVAGSTVLHTSGLLTAAALAPLVAARAAVASWHPLQAFTGDVDPPLAGVPCAVEGDPAAVAAGFALARGLGMLPWSVAAADKVRYHAAAAVAANLSHILVAAGRDLLATCDGLPLDPGKALAPVVRASIEAALASAGLDHLTGAVARGDRATVAAHLAALPAPLARVYELLAALAGSQRARSGGLD